MNFDQNGVEKAAAVKKPAPIPLLDTKIFESTRAAVPSFDVLLEIFRTDTVEYLDTIRNALTVGDKQACLIPSHTIKGNARIMGASGLAALAGSMEQRLKQQKADSVPELNQLRQRMISAFQATLEKIKQKEAASTATQNLH